MVVFQILRGSKFGPSAAKHGIVHLLEKGFFMSAYPLHDEMVEWTELGKLSDRQILSKYWANATSFFKHQPLNLIEKYFGAEVSFYFAFLKHYSLTLWWASAFGLLCFLYGVITISSVENHLRWVWKDTLTFHDDDSMKFMRILTMFYVLSVMKFVIAT